MRRTVSRALRAAMRARVASATLAQMRFAWAGCSSSHADSLSLSMVSTMLFASVLESLVLVWPSKLAPGSLSAITAARPSRMSSPLGSSSFRSLKRLFLVPCAFTVRVRAALKPMRWVPPSWLWMLLAKAKTFSS